ncbi:MAG: hypothetical protein K2O58_02260 [Bacteroidales bacterium]|nr:hypothetical protein [Bacteroidales bacterium]MDE7126705.1 hypothetical protein [Bacteroidales bacterium]
MIHRKSNIAAFVSGYALPAVLVISVVILLLILAVYSALSLDLRQYSVYHDAKQRREDMEAAIVLLCRDSCLCAYGEAAEVNPFKDRMAIGMRRYCWGLYDIAVMSDSAKDTLVVMLGKYREHSAGAAFWLCDRNRALSLSAGASIAGIAYIPLSGINYTSVGSQYYDGEHLPDNLVRIAGKELPHIECSVSEYARRLCGRTAVLCPSGFLSSEYMSFRGSGVSSIVYGELQDTLLGHVHVIGDVLEFSAQAFVSDIIVSARKVILKSGFHGRMQIFASDTVLVESGVSLEYPSGIYVDSGTSRPYVRLNDGSKVSGYVVVTGECADLQLRYPSYVQEGRAGVEGLLYVNGSCELGGYISGAAYVRDCYSFSEGNIYAGTLYGIRMSRCDSLAFPVLLGGDYHRRQIKMLH